MTKQMNMFETEDLPLFSGTAQRVEVSPFEMQTVHTQEALPANCRLCQDTGLLGEMAYCWCEVGQERKRAKHGDGR